MGQMSAPRIDELEVAIRRYLVDTFLGGGEASDVTVSTPLISGGVIDSVARLSLINHLEAEYGIEIQAHEAHASHMDTIAQIAQLVRAKMGGT